MQKTKIIIALVAVAILTLTIGIASAQISASQTNSGTSPNNGFWGWMGNCFGLRNNQQSANQYVAPPTSTNSPIPAPNQGNGNNYGFGPCWERFNESP